MANDLVAVERRALTPARSSVDRAGVPPESRMARQHHQSQNPPGLPTKGVQFTGQAGRNLLSGCMESPHALRQRVDREVQFKSCLHLAATRLKDANRERIWAVVAAHKAGLSIR